MATSVEFGDLKITLTEKYSLPTVKAFIDEVTWNGESVSQYKADPKITLSQLGIEVEGDTKLNREMLMRALAKNGIPGDSGDPQALIGPAIVFVIIVLYPI